MTSLSSRRFLSQFLVVLAQTEKAVELSRQVLAENPDFEPYTAFKRLNRSRRGKISEGELLNFMEGTVGRVTPRESSQLFIVLDKDGDGVLSFDEFLDAILPKRNDVLKQRATIREPYYLGPSESLPRDTEFQLSRVFEKEIDNLKSVNLALENLNSCFDFDPRALFDLLDDNKQGFLDFESVESFLKNQGKQMTEAEIEGIFLRLDRNRDGKIDFREFREGVQGKVLGLSVSAGLRASRSPSPARNERSSLRAREEPKEEGEREEPAKNNAYASPARSQERRSGYGSPVQNSGGSRRSLYNSPPKSRAVLNMEYEDYLREGGSPNRWALRSYERRRIFEEEVREAPKEEPKKEEQPEKKEESPKEEPKEEEQPEKEEEVPKEEQEKEAASKSEGRRSRADVARSSQRVEPEDNSSTRKPLRESLEENGIYTLSGSRSVRRSRREPKPEENKQEEKPEEVVDSKAAPRRVQSFAADKEEPEKAAKEVEAPAEEQEKRAQPARSERRDSRNSTPIQANPASSNIVTSAYKNTPSDIRSAPRDQASSSRVAGSPPRGRNSSPSRVVSPLRVRDEFQLAKYLSQVIESNKEVEKFKNDLSLRVDFNLLDAFRLFDLTESGSITQRQLESGLGRLGVYASSDQAYLFFKRFNSSGSGLLRYSEFADALTPRQPEYADLVKNRESATREDFDELTVRKFLILLPCFLK